jgi:Flp pilus assembly protein TadB
MFNAPFRFLTLFIVVILGFGWVAMGNVEFLQPTATRLRAQEEQMEIDARRVEIEATQVAINRAQEQEAALNTLHIEEAEAQSASRLRYEQEHQALWLWLEEVLMYAVSAVIVLMGVACSGVIFYTGVRWAHIALPTSRPSRRPRFTPSATQGVLPPTTLRAPFIAASRQNDTVEWMPVKIRPRRRERHYHS